MKLIQEIFAVGTWNGFPFTLNDLRKMAASFNALSEFLKVPLKLGHNEEQDITDGQPALGWVSAMEVVGNKLVATFENVPDIILEAFEKKLYRSVSIELDFDVEHKETKYDFVVTAVALLGADMPAVNVLNDLAAFMSASSNSDLAKSGYAASKHLSFTTLTGNRGVSTMTPEEEAKLRQELAEAKADVTTAAAKFTALETTSATDKAKFEADKEQFDKDQLKIKIDAARLVFTTMLEEAVKEKAITPAQREAFTKALRIDDDVAVLLIKEEDVKALFGAEDDKGKFSRHTAKDDNDGATSNSSEDLTGKTYEYMAKSGVKDFTTAMFSVMRANPELARDYVDSNGEVKQQ